jgi:hypothetical protein
MGNYTPDFDWWLIRATKKIKYRPDRYEVYTELSQHLEDRYLDFLDQGQSEEEAEKLTLGVMGDVDELASQLSVIHRPFWGYLYTLCKWIFIVLTIITVLKAIPWIHSQYATIQHESLIHAYGIASDLNPYEATYCNIYHRYDESHTEKFNYTWNRIFFTQPDCKASLNGYTFTISNVAVWCAQDLPQDIPTTKEQLYIQMDISTLFPLTKCPDFPRWFWAEDSLGNYYYSYNEYFPREYGMEEYTNPEPSLSGNIHKSDINTYTYNIWVRGTNFQNMNWIELHYDRGNKDIVLHIDLTKSITP